jgi:hypothetical protein
MRTAARLKGQLTPIAVAACCAAVIFVGGTSVAGIQGSGFRLMSVGRIEVSDVGTLTVNGVEYATTGAKIHIDNREGSQAELKVGQVVTVKGVGKPGSGTADALDIWFTGDVRGPISSIDSNKHAIVVLGQTVHISEDTESDADPLAIGTRIEVSGFRTAKGDLSASHVELATEATSQVRGAIGSLDTNAATFRVNALTIDYSGATVGGALVEGATAAIEGTALEGGASLRASHVEVASSSAGAAGAHGDLEGIITGFVSAADFQLGNQRIVADADTQVVTQGHALGLDVAVKVRGTFDAGGVLVADRIEVWRNGLGAMRGPVESVNAAQGSLTVLGVSVVISKATKFTDRSKQRLRRFGFVDLRTGDTVEIRGSSRGRVFTAQEVRLIER